MVYCMGASAKDRISKQEYIKTVLDLPEIIETEIFTDEEKDEQYEIALKQAARFVK